MSIPPLVCSTPPPPDQCEDDKDPEYFDLSYNLSQEDDDDIESDGYNYGNFTHYNNFQLAPDNNSFEVKDHAIRQNSTSEISKEMNLKYENVNELENSITSQKEINIHNIIQDKSEDDGNIEDLDLKVDEEIDSIVEENVDIKANVSSNSNNSSPTCDNAPIDDIVIENASPISNEPSYFVTSQPEISMDVDINVKCKDNADCALQDITFNSENESSENVKLKENINVTNNESIEQSLKDTEENVITDDDDDFGDFNDFKSVNISNVTNVVEESNNPWENAVSNESDFGSFTANFEEANFHSENLSPMDTEPASIKLERLESETKHTAVGILGDDDDDDDFGDFDDFKSSATKTQSVELTESLQSDELPVFNIHATENEHQILERIATVLSSVYIEEISDPGDKFEGKLESLLSETWGHLMETDERQPYIVNWNSSFGQKSLLKALCIDSRNILFGPKWSGNMPKYAANLSIAPLQPQKQTSAPSSIVTQSEPASEKPSNKPTTSWEDPFTSDGQESCNTDNESATITPLPTDLKVFEATIDSKPEKIFSNTLGVQPIRQINLPDTHIFTPTDSEIPRSKTIHYDLSPTILFPQPALEDNKNQTDSQNTPMSRNLVENNSDDNEYWEFQNFKGPSDASSLPGTSRSHLSEEKNYEMATTVNFLPAPSVAFQTELLQPIKIEPSVPKLNWPDPGEIKDVFDDFSDFVSITTQHTQNLDNSSISPEFQLGTEKAKPADLPLDDTTLSQTPSTIKNPVYDRLEDDFDTFQSALPSKSLGDSSNSNYLGNISQASPLNNCNVTSKVDSFKSESISFTSITRPNEALTQNLGHINRSELTINKSSTLLSSNIQGNILQPTPVNFSTTTQNHQKSGQILQPLSLESYSQINWPSPGIDLQDLSRFNPVESVHSLKSDSSTNSMNIRASPAHTSQTSDDDVWGEFVSSKPKQTQSSHPKKASTFVDDDEWTDFISSPTVKPQNGLNTISLNVHTNSNIHKSSQNKFVKKTNQPPIDIPTLNYVTPKSNPHKTYNDKHFQNL